MTKNFTGKGHECYHCKQWIDAGVEHDCWTTTEAALTRDLTDDLREAWERLRETAAEFGDQRIYASHRSIMFARRACYFFVRPKRTALEVCFFIGRPLRAPQIRRTDRVSQAKVAHTLHLTHRDEVEAPMTEWLREAYDFVEAPKPPVKRGPAAKKPRKAAAEKPSAARPRKKSTTRRPR